jgi:hypothetical protein
MTKQLTSLFLPVGDRLPLWALTCSMLESWLQQNTKVYADDSVGWVDIDQSMLALTTGLFARLRLRPVHVGLYVSKGQGDHSIHQHLTSEHARLNLPISNCEGSSTVFYSTEGHGKFTTNAQGASFLSFDEHQCKETVRITVDEPTVLHIKTAHRVLAPTATPDRPRVTASFQFNRDPVFLLRASQNDATG